MADGGVLLRRYIGVLILGAIVILIGLLFLAASTTPRFAATTFSIPAGANYCTHYAFGTVGGGTIAISFTSNSGPIDQYVVTQAEYDTWAATGTINYIAFDSGTSGVFTATLPSTDSYQVMSCHGAGYENTVESGSHTMTINALNPAPFYVGIAVLVGGVILAIVSLWMRTKPEKRPLYAAPPPYVQAGAWPGQWRGPAPPGPVQPGSWPAAPQPGIGPPGTWPAGTVPLGPAPVAPPTGGPVAFGTIVAEVVNPSPAPITVQILLNGVPTTSVTVPPVGRTPVTLHPPLPVPAGTTVRVEAVTPDGRRAVQDVLATSTVAAQATLRID